MTAANMVDAAVFSPDVSIGRIHVADLLGNGTYNSGCIGEDDTLGGFGSVIRGLIIKGTRTAPSDPTMAFPYTNQVAHELVAEALSPDLAQNITERLLLEEGLCQNEPPTHWVYGKTTTLRLAPDVTASWMGMYVGTLNTTGTAPAGKEPCGGVAVLHSGTHYGLLDIEFCLGTAEMNRVVRAALSRL
ncbi:hypothetical protein [Streptacidiphilus jiangxiensis]|uniref:Uncharacterized protein n=1 Tax=Streptacidiphilus jiangxiensis TaxID=235985 RepID=A0A1H7PLB7_STRJI|nr:hypothetical protein [Streptacidiphilus jiangxiensis]SEL36419.1 hypothetical protein SAMN05414137_1089 [Streptacidiphilus jiangxiensis]